MQAKPLAKLQLKIFIFNFGMPYAGVNVFPYARYGNIVKNYKLHTVKNKVHLWLAD